MSIKGPLLSESTRRKGSILRPNSRFDVVSKEKQVENVDVSVRLLPLETV